MKSAVAAHVWKEKHTRDHKPVLLKQAFKQRRINKQGKYFYNENKVLIINFKIPPADH